MRQDFLDIRGIASETGEVFEYNCVDFPGGNGGEQTVAAISAVGRFSSAGGVADLQAAIAAGVAAYRAGAVTR